MPSFPDHVGAITQVEAERALAFHRLQALARTCFVDLGLDYATVDSVLWRVWLDLQDDVLHREGGDGG